MRPLILVLLIGASLIPTAPLARAQPRVEKSSGTATERRALSLVQDIVPRAPFPATPWKISDRDTRGFWGTLFGDTRVAALVAVAPERNDDAHSSLTTLAPAQLCLLLWDGRWKIQQHVGEVSQETYDGKWDWKLARRNASEGYYVLSQLNLYPPDLHNSWFCDAATHRLVATGWRRDALPSLGEKTITFISSGKPGYSPDIFTVHHFEGGLGKLIASWQKESTEYTDQTYRISLPEAGSETIQTWRFRRLTPATTGEDRWFVGRIDNGGTPIAKEEDATVKFHWGGDTRSGDGTAFLISRFTGLEIKAIRGIWASEPPAPELMLEETNVSGSPAAVERFTWSRENH